MKTCCKNANPLDINQIRPSVYNLITDKYRRKDYSKFISEYCDYSPKEIRTFEKYQLDEPIDNICKEIIEMIYNGKLEFKPVHYSVREDPCSHKKRRIGIEHPLMQCTEHVAKDLLSELWQKKLEFHQYATIKGKGQVKGAKQIRTWVLIERRTHKVYFVKLDIHHCFQTIKHSVVMRYLKRDIGKNKLLLWLVEALLEFHGNGLLEPEEETDDGLIIGSILSQFLCNYLMSYAMRFAYALAKTRRGKRIPMIQHQLFYMDDIFSMGSSKNNLSIATKRLISFIENDLELSVKDDWSVKDIDDEPIDMMGFRIFADGRMDIRPRTFLRARRCYLNGEKNGFKIHTARRATAYYGYFKHARINDISSDKNKTFKVVPLKRKASKIVSKHDKEA